MGTRRKTMENRKLKFELGTKVEFDNALFKGVGRIVKIDEWDENYPYIVESLDIDEVSEIYGEHKWWFKEEDLRATATTIYIAGSLFSEAEVTQRTKEGEMLATALQEQGLEDFKIFNPITNPFNDKSTLPTATDIFLGDYTVIRDDMYHFFVNLDNPLDAGVMMELGQVLQMIEQGKDIKVYPILSDIRVGTAGEYNDINVPWGYNQYVIGALEHYGIHVYESFGSALMGFVIDASNAQLEIISPEVTVYAYFQRLNKPEETIKIYEDSKLVYEGKMKDMQINHFGHAMIKQVEIYGINDLDYSIFI